MKTFLLFAAFAAIACAAWGTEDIPAPTTRSLPAPGPDGMIVLAGTTRDANGYTISNFEQSFLNALGHCETTGRRLLSIEDRAEQRQVSMLLASYGVNDRTWTSGTEEGGELFWASTLEPLNYTNIGNNNYCHDRNCLAILNTGVNRGKWWYTECSEPYRFICENK